MRPAQRPLPRAIVVLEDNVILHIAQHEAIKSHFPLLARVAPFAKSCGTCGKKQQQKAEALAQARQHLATLDGAHQSLLKNFLNASKIRIMLRRPDGGYTPVEF